MKIKSVSKKIVTLKNIEVLASLVHDIKRSPMHLPSLADQVATEKALQHRTQ